MSEMQCRCLAARAGWCQEVNQTFTSTKNGIRRLRQGSFMHAPIPMAEGTSNDPPSVLPSFGASPFLATAK